MTNPIHSFGDLSFLPWPTGASVVFRVERWNGSYVATYTDEASAHKRAAAERGRYDAKVCPVRRTGY